MMFNSTGMTNRSGLAHVVSQNRSVHLVVSCLAWLCVVLLAVAHLPLPLTGDQALFMYGAKTLARGQALYLDFWDVKQPGVYLFYLAAGKLFSFDAVGLHLLEALWWAIAAYCGYRIARVAIQRSLAAHLVPLFTAGTYLVVTGAWHLTQPDGLVTTPLAVAIWALCDKSMIKRHRMRLAISGFATGVAVIFKLSIILLPLSFYAFWLFGRPRVVVEQGSRTRDALTIAASAALPVLLICGWFWWHGALQQLLWTTFRYPLTAFSQIDHHVGGLLSSILWFANKTVGWLPLAAAGAYWSLRRWRAGQSRGLPGMLMLIWLGVGFLTILLQYHYWWAFHFNQLFLPVGVLAAIGLDRAVRYALREGVSVWLPRGAVVLVSFAAVVFVARATEKVVELGAAVRGHDDLISAYVDHFEPAWNDIRASLHAALPAGSHDESIYVFGDPRLLLESGAQQAVPHNGWALEIMTRRQWADFSKALMIAIPRRIYVSDHYHLLLQDRAPEIIDWLRDNYDQIHSDGWAGVWFMSRAVATGPSG